MIPGDKILQIFQLWKDIFGVYSCEMLAVKFYKSKMAYGMSKYCEWEQFMVLRSVHGIVSSQRNVDSCN